MLATSLRNLKLTFADIHPPNVVQGTSTLAVNTFGLVRPNDNVAQGGTLLQNEHCVLLASLTLASADLGVTVVLLHPTIEALSFGDLDRGSNCSGSGGGGDGLGETSWGSSTLIVADDPWCSDRSRSGLWCGRSGDSHSGKEDADQSLAEHCALFVEV